MQKISLNFQIVDKALIPVIESFLAYKYKNCFYNDRDNLQFIAGEDRDEIVNAINDVRTLCILAVGNINK